MNRVAIPMELLECDQWLIATPKKIPGTLNERGRIVAADVKDRVKYLDYVTARGVADEANEMLPTAAYGVGFALTSEDSYCVVDIDIKDERNEPDVGKRTPKELRDTLMSIVNWLDSYTEHSRSGVGYHVWVKVPRDVAATLPNIKKPGIEVYFRDRYIVTTGDVVANKPIADRSSHIDALLRSLAPEKFVAEQLQSEDVVVEEERFSGGHMDDGEVFERLFSLENGEKYELLVAGEWEGFYESQSEADMALFEGLFFVTRDVEQSRRLFLGSGLGARAKAKRADYMDKTIMETLHRIRLSDGIDDDIAEAVDDVLSEMSAPGVDGVGVALPVVSACMYEYGGVLVDLSGCTSSNDVVAHVMKVVAGTDADIAAEIARAVGIWRSVVLNGASTVAPTTSLIVLPDQVPEIKERVADSSFDMRSQVRSMLSKSAGGVVDDNLACFGGYDGKTVDIPYPPGITGDLMRYLADSSSKGVKEVAIAAGLATISGICGKAYQIDGTGTNLYIAILGASGIGKTSVLNGAQTVMKDVSVAAPSAANVFCHSRAASMQALLKHAEKIDSFVMRIDEFGKMLNSAMSGRSAGDASVVDEMVRLYDKSGRDAVVQGIAYSNSDKNINIGKNIAVTVLGDATSKGYYEALSADSSEDGFLSRFIQIEYTGQYLYTNYNRVQSVPKEVLDRLVDLVTNADNLMRTGNYVDVVVSIEAKAKLMQLDTDTTDLMNSGAIPDDRIYLYNRKALKIMKIAAVLAIMEDHMNPKIEIEQFDWALDLVNQINARELWWIKQGMVAGSASSIEIEEVIAGRLRDYFSSPSGTPRDVAMAKKGALTSKKLRSLVETLPAVKKSKIGARDAATKIIKALEDSGVIKHHSRHYAKKLFGAVSSTCYSYDPNMDDALQEVAE